MWVINTGEKNIEVCIIEMHKWVFFKPGVPVELETMLALRYINQYQNLIECKEPQKHFKDKPMKRLVIRDAGIGDLLLLEPVLRAVKNIGNVEMTVVTRYPEVYFNNPSIDVVIPMSAKENIPVKFADYDTHDDIRSYSETSPTRAKVHRTDVYNEKFNIALKEKEPRLYFGKREKPLLQKKAGYTYIGISVDASHQYRGYHNGIELIEKLLENKKNIVVIFGAEKDLKIKHRRVIDLQGKTTIREMINYVRGIDKMIAVDSGVMHVALTLHVPTVCLFTIITPDLRVRYYTGEKSIVTADSDCLFCGDFHMSKCQKTKATCLDIAVDKIIKSVDALNKSETKEYYKPKSVAIIAHSTPKLTMPIIVQNEERNLPRFIELVMQNKSIGEVIAIDGGSTDKTVSLLEKAGAKVFIHPYVKTYHEQQAMQRNISCSYVADGTKIIIMDIDECFSDELSAYLPELAGSAFEYGLISRRTFKLFKDIKNPGKQIKDYPDWQPRFYTWNRKYKFVGGAHHVTLNCPEPVKIQKDIIHFEEEGKDRQAIEKQWSSMMTGVKQLMR